ncbi:MAG: 2Fe-2S iron-sulfur cluster-binding protein [Solirubrobacteraceae bacterium]
MRVARVDRLTEDAVAVTLDVPGELREAYRHRAGQHVVVLHEHGGEVIRRSYSICSEEAAPELRIAIKRIPGGAFSSFATSELAPGRELQVMVPTGHFTPSLNRTHRKHYGAVAVGSGITPILSIAGSVLAAEPGSRVTLLYGNRTRRSTMLAGEVAGLRARHGDRVVIRHALSREAARGCLRGRIDEAMLAQVFDVASVQEWFMCGPEPLMQQLDGMLTRHGVAQDTIHRELFLAGDATELDPDARPDLTSEVELRLDGSPTRFELHARGRSILDAALELRPGLPYACSEGVCATCRAQVLEGEVEMDRCSALDRREREAGYVLTCQAHPVSERLVLDFDA